MKTDALQYHEELYYAYQSVLTRLTAILEAKIVTRSFSVDNVLYRLVMLV